MSKKSNGADARIKEAETKAERLELFATAMELERMLMERSALNSQIEKMQTEANMITARIKEISSSGEGLMKEYQARYADFKKKLKVPEGKEINLKTGELVDTPPPEEQGQQPAQVKA
jgi:hypothetical protein